MIIHEVLDITFKSNWICTSILGLGNMGFLHFMYHSGKYLTEVIPIKNPDSLGFSSLLHFWICVCNVSLFFGLLGDMVIHEVLGSTFKSDRIYLPYAETNICLVFLFFYLLRLCLDLSSGN